MIADSFEVSTHTFFVFVNVLYVATGYKTLQITLFKIRRLYVACCFWEGAGGKQTSVHQKQTYVCCLSATSVCELLNILTLQLCLEPIDLCVPEFPCETPVFTSEFKLLHAPLHTVKICTKSWEWWQLIWGLDVEFMNWTFPAAVFILWILILNKNTFQSKAHLPLANRRSDTYNLTLEWP